MNETKPWYVSRTIWASIVVVGATLSGALGFPVADGEAQELLDLVVQGVAAAAGIAAIAGRMLARSRIG